MQLSASTIIIISALLVFVIYRRVRRNIGWQQLIQRKLIRRIFIFLIIGMLLISGGALHPINLISDFIGILIGIALAYYGSKMTNFEKRDGYWYYRPNTWIGSAVSAIFFLRLIYRIYNLYILGDLSKLQQQGQDNDFQNISYAVGNSWTSGLMLIMFAYYVTYYLIIFRKQKELSTEKNA
ncbi:MAG TPA: hypothetical protein VNR61_07990 [Niallia sp.]|nr:hypothetical protein [Niallia sp.]